MGMIVVITSLVAAIRPGMLTIAVWTISSSRFRSSSPPFDSGYGRSSDQIEAMA